MELLTVRPLVYSVDAYISDGTEDIYNELEDVTYYPEEGDIVLSGTLNEQWIVPAEKFLRKYCMPDGSDIDLDEIDDGEWHEVVTRESSYTSECHQVPIEEGEGEVETARGDVLVYNRDGVEHGTGDYIFVDGDDQWVVNGAVFENTYEII